jgi:hypothetical protein
VNLGDGRVGVPMTAEPDQPWMEEFKTALAESAPGDEALAHAADTATADAIPDAPMIVLRTSGVGGADFLMRYLSELDRAIETANEGRS